MEYKVGRHITRSGLVAYVLVDWEEAGLTGSAILYPLEGVITDSEGNKKRFRWTREGLNRMRGPGENDLMPIKKRFSMYMFTSWGEDGEPKVSYHAEREPLEKVRSRQKIAENKKVSDIAEIEMEEE